ncbi:MAG: zf-TFIIB domain-containing protein [Sandaracinaceae bacterium]|nr:zf-TFIIB domain-containing protein [Sandaracinaceae bacterium]
MSMTSEPTTRECARCGAHLHHATLQGFSLLGCGACGGVFMDQEAAAKVVDGGVWQAGQLAETLERGTTADLAALTREPCCPECGVVMAPAHLMGVELDVCAEHGTWFDRGELRFLLRAVSPPTTPQLAVRRPAPAKERYRWLATFPIFCNALVALSTLAGFYGLIAALFFDGYPDFPGAAWALLQASIGVSFLLAAAQASKLLLDLADRGELS